MRAPAALLLVATLWAAHAAAGEAASPVLSQAACVAAASAGVPPSRLAALARGFNLPGWLEGSAPRRPDMAVLASLHARGFTHIRLPVGAERLMDEFSPGGDVARQLAELDYAIDKLTRLGFAVSIDMHPGERFSQLHVAQPERAFALLEELWRMLARRYAGRSPERVLFEALNEPVVNWTIWKDQAPRLVAAIRREAPLHTIIMGHPDYSRVDALPAVSPPAARRPGNSPGVP